MPRPYLVGWGYALRVYFKTFKRAKASRRMWIKLVKRKYYWLTTEERVESNKKCLGTIAELGRKAFPNGISKDYLDDYYEEIEEEYDRLQTKKCLCGREYPDLPMYFNEEGLCLICSQE